MKAEEKSWTSEIPRLGSVGFGTFDFLEFRNVLALECFGTFGMFGLLDIVDISCERLVL